LYTVRGKERIELSRNKKTQSESDLQLTTQESAQPVVIAASCGTQKETLEKEEASKPIYLKRV